MKIMVNVRRLKISAELKKYIKRRLQFALGSRSDQIQRVEVVLSDLNGPKGGEDKHCRMLLKLDGHQDVVIEDVDSEMQAVVDKAANRASLTVTKRLDRLRHKAKRFRKRLPSFGNVKRDRYMQEDFDEFADWEAQL